MLIIKVSGTALKRELAEYLRDGIGDSWLFSLERGDENEKPATGEEIERWLSGTGLPREAAVVLETNEPFEGLRTNTGVFITDAPIADLPAREAGAAVGADLVVVRAGKSFAAGSRGIEAAMKEATGAGKVLIYREEEGRDRAFAKSLDMVLGRLGEDMMPEDMPQGLIDAVKAASEDGRMSCGKAHELAAEMDVPLALVGRALDLLDVKITNCQLGCF